MQNDGDWSTGQITWPQLLCSLQHATRGRCSGKLPNADAESSIVLRDDKRFYHILKVFFHVFMYWYSNHEKKFLRSFLHLWMSTYVPTTSLCCRRGHHLASMPTTSRLSPTMLLCQCDKRRIIVPVVIMPKTAWTLSCRQLGMRTDIRMWNNIRIIKCSYGYPVVGIMKLAKCGLVTIVSWRLMIVQLINSLTLISCCHLPPLLPPNPQCQVNGRGRR